MYAFPLCNPLLFFSEGAEASRAAAGAGVGGVAGEVRVGTLSRFKIWHFIALDITGFIAKI